MVYFEAYNNVDKAIAREKQIKGWTRKKKEALINKVNPEWKIFMSRLNYKKAVVTQ